MPLSISRLLPPSCAGDARRRRVGGEDEGEDENRASRVRPWGPDGPVPGLRAGLTSRRSPCGSYFDGHFAITPFGATVKPSGDSVPFSTTSASSLNVSGTTPV